MTISGYQNAYTTDAITMYSTKSGLRAKSTESAQPRVVVVVMGRRVIYRYSTDAGWRAAPYKLSNSRESAAAMALGNAVVSVAGWQKNSSVCGAKEYCGDAVRHRCRAS